MQEWRSLARAGCTSDMPRATIRFAHHYTESSEDRQSSLRHSSHPRHLPCNTSSSRSWPLSRRRPNTQSCSPRYRDPRTLPTLPAVPWARLRKPESPALVNPPNKPLEYRSRSAHQPRTRRQEGGPGPPTPGVACPRGQARPDRRVEFPIHESPCQQFLPLRRLGYHGPAGKLPSFLESLLLAPARFPAPWLVSRMGTLLGERILLAILRAPLRWAR